MLPACLLYLISTPLYCTYSTLLYIQHRPLTSSSRQLPALSKPSSTRAGSAHSRPYGGGGDDAAEGGAFPFPARPTARSQQLITRPPPPPGRTNILRTSPLFHPLHRSRTRLRQRPREVYQQHISYIIYICVCFNIHSLYKWDEKHIKSRLWSLGKKMRGTTTIQNYPMYVWYGRMGKCGGARFTRR